MCFWKMPALALCQIFKSAFHAKSFIQFDYALVRDSRPSQLTFFFCVLICLAMCHSSIVGFCVSLVVFYRAGQWVDWRFSFKLLLSLVVRRRLAGFRDVPHSPSWFWNLKDVSFRPQLMNRAWVKNYRWCHFSFSSRILAPLPICHSRVFSLRIPNYA